eukprot:1219796-Alexandrium_andersonii.AAC.1
MHRAPRSSTSSMWTARPSRWRTSGASASSSTRRRRLSPPSSTAVAGSGGRRRRATPRPLLAG